MTPLHRLSRLTLRKVSVLLHLEAGRSYKQIASDMKIHEETVRKHVQAIADGLPDRPLMSPRDKVLIWCERLLEMNADTVAKVKRAA